MERSKLRGTIGMRSLYGRLFHATSYERHRLEDFLTEVLADLFNRLEAPQLRILCRDFLLINCDPQAKEQWLDRAFATNQFAWTSQSWITTTRLLTSKRPDLILWSDKRENRDVDSFDRENHGLPLMIIECKIGAPFTKSKDSTGNDAALHQLQSYDRWLGDKAGQNGALVVLTHFSDVPTDFLHKESQYETRVRTVRRWSELYKWLAKEDGQALWGPASSVLVTELLGFLREKNLMTNEPSPQDLAAARLYLVSGADARVVSSFASIRKVVQDRFGKLKSFPEKRINLEYNPDREYGAISDHCNFHRDVWVYWGVYFGRGFWGDHIEPPPSRSDGGFIWIDFPKKVSRFAGKKFLDWHFPGAAETDDLAVGKMIDVDPLGDNFTAAFSEWLMKALEEAKEIIDLSKN